MPCRPDPRARPWRHVEVTDRHAAVDYAQVLKDLTDVHFASARTIVLVQDSLSVHSKASLYQAFPAPEAKRLVDRLEWHYTPKHGSWFNLAESELGVLTKQASIAVFPTNKLSSTRSPHASTTETQAAPKQTGNSRPEMLASNSSISTRQSE